MEELIKDLQDLELALTHIGSKLHLTEKSQKVGELEKLTEDPNFWQSPTAKDIMQELAGYQQDIAKVAEIKAEIISLTELAQMLSSEPDESMTADLVIQIQKLHKKIALLENETYLSGKYDRNFTILSIHSGQGGTEAQDWAEMLRRMYLRYFELKNWKVDLLEESRGEEAGIKSVSLLVKGKESYGYLKREQGTHRLVRLSPFNADSLRQTSFAMVEVIPEIETDDEIQIRDEDLEWAFFRSGGHGGQNVNKVNTAVRLRHLPSGIVIESQSQRYQEQNRKIALQILTAKLWQIKEANEKKELQALKGGTMASWGTQIRNYVLHPYQLVKDLRSNYETTNTEAILDGNLDELIQSLLKLE